MVMIVGLLRGGGVELEIDEPAGRFEGGGWHVNCGLVPLVTLHFLMMTLNQQTMIK